MKTEKLRCVLLRGEWRRNMLLADCIQNHQNPVYEVQELLLLSKTPLMAIDLKYALLYLLWKRAYFFHGF